MILLAVQANSLRTVPYAISAWAYSFPLAAAATALLAAGHAGSREGYTWLGVATLMVASLTVAVLLVWSVVAVRRGEICRPGH